ncbi:MAG: beta-ketoacyl-[acyl-carrier-protein] synthase [Panacagrimonas sp.]|nr:beta-ketoacyl-[acyl-carrier-protein] synthase family protein [Panacagrimonas sp.]MCC2657813.1 beta-ketoacyl-[acyl-carrier-protein] synthase [Panacagrimonas sp.]
MKPLRVSHYTLTTAVGAGIGAHAAALQSQTTGLRPCPAGHAPSPTWTGQVDDLSIPLTAELAPFDCRNNRLAELGLQQDGFIVAVERARAQYGADRVGLFLGTSTSGIQQTEAAYAARDASGALPSWFDFDRTQNLYSCAAFVGLRLRLEGISHVTSTACASSAKVFASAYRALQAGLCDAAVVGGVDSLCRTTLYGFASLQLLSSGICRPGDARRDGISIGEAAGFALLETTPGAGVALLGYGESGDAHHMSTPDPSGRGAIAAMAAALERAGLQPADIDYVNLHGTGTPANDLAEDTAVATLLGTQVPCSSTKGWTGHTLGAAGIVEAAISLLAMQGGVLPRSLNTRVVDPALRCAVLMDNRAAAVRTVLSNSFGFGGTNCSLIFGMR